MNKFFVTLIAALAMTLAGPVSFADGCEPTTSDPEVAAGDAYVDIDGTADGVWVYTESNGIDGLQRQDESHDDTCKGIIAPDTLVI